MTLGCKKFRTDATIRVFRFALPGYILSLEIFQTTSNNQLLMRKKLLTILALLTFLAGALAQTGSRLKMNQALPAGYWPFEKSQPIVDKTQTIRPAPELSHLSP